MRAIYKHCLSVFEKMADDAELRIVEIDGREIEVYVWEGFLTHLFASLNLGIPLYTQVMGELRRMDCVRQIRRGGGTTKSQWQIVQAPSEILYDKMPGSERRPGSTQWAKEQRIWQAVRDLTRRVEALERPGRTATTTQDRAVDALG